MWMIYHRKVAWLVIYIKYTFIYVGLHVADAFRVICLRIVRIDLYLKVVCNLL